MAKRDTLEHRQGVGAVYVIGLSKGHALRVGGDELWNPREGFKDKVSNGSALAHEELAHGTFTSKLQTASAPENTFLLEHNVL